MAKLFMVATPIGNLQDISQRAIDVLTRADFILAEDTRHTRQLMEALQIKGKNLLSYHQHSSDKQVETIKSLLAEDKDLALVSDAGTPGINDPGNLLLEALFAAGVPVEVIPVPGASALTSLLSVAGLDINPFTYLGFLPHKKGREKLFKMMAENPETAFVFMDNPHRLAKNLEKMMDFVGSDRPLLIGREITKQFETFYRGSIKEAYQSFVNDKNHDKGEVIALLGKLK
ncbi:MAG TPA: 16S rRNA (cytidine(1402)-2'-O)-methyltransferase [bacterium]|nr:16S rRNA (cytidine(1402)-2'-O)-methyltransferase [bacterium]